MNKKTTAAADIDPRAIAADFFRKLGGMEGMAKWGKTHRSLAYQLIAKLMAQPLVQNNVNVANIAIDGEAVRRKLEDAIERMRESKKYLSEDPAVYVNDMLVIEGYQQDASHVLVDGVSYTRTDATVVPETTIDPRPSTAGARPATDATRPRTVVRSFVAGQSAGGALDGSADDNRSTTQKYLDWSGHGKLF
jgi:hypothetical protein